MDVSDGTSAAFVKLCRFIDTETKIKSGLLWNGKKKIFVSLGALASVLSTYNTVFLFVSRFHRKKNEWRWHGIQILYITITLYIWELQEITNDVPNASYVISLNTNKYKNINDTSDMKNC